MKVIRCFSVLTAVILIVLQIAASAARVTSVHVPLQGDVALSNGDVVSFTGQVHVLTRVTFSETFLPAVQMYFNLQAVQGTSATSARTYLLVGSANSEWIGISPGPPDIPEQNFGFSLVEINPLGVNPGPPDLPPSPIVPVFFLEFAFAQEAGHEGTLQNVTASFVSD